MYATRRTISPHSDPSRLFLRLEYNAKEYFGRRAHSHSVRHGGSSLASLRTSSLLDLHGARGTKLNLTAAIKTQGAQAMVLLEEVNIIFYIYYLIHHLFAKTTSMVYSLVVECC